jgi:hypothetical protein
MKKTFVALAAALLLAACASPASITLGMTRDEVLAKMGAPTRVMPLDNGAQRLQYSLQPAGQYAWMVDLDTAGRVTGVRQVLNQNDFGRIVPGQWTRLDIEREFGPPARIDGVGGWHGPVLTYRWKDAAGADMFYWVYLDSAGVVRRAHPGMELRDRFFFDWRS